MYCRKCGRKLEDSWNVCPNCGNCINAQNMDIQESIYSQQTFKTRILKKWQFWVSVMVAFGLIITIMATCIMVKKRIIKEASNNLNSGIEEVDFSDQDFEDLIGKSETELEGIGLKRGEEPDVYSGLDGNVQVSCKNGKVDMIWIKRKTECTPAFHDVRIGMDSEKAKKKFLKTYTESEDSSSGFKLLDPDSKRSIKCIVQDGKIYSIQFQMLSKSKDSQYKTTKEYTEDIACEVPVEPEPDPIFSPDRVGYYSNGYWAMDLKSIDTESKKVIYDGYEGGYSEIPSCSNEEGVIIDSNTLDILGVRLVWDNENSFTIHNAEDCMIFSSMAGATTSHDVQHGAGVYRKIQKPELPVATPIADHSAEYVGVWVDEYSQRCFMDISCSDGIYYIQINWSGGASDTEQWDLVGEYDSGSNGIVYFGSRKEVHYSDGGDFQETYMYTDGSGRLFIGNDGILYWDDYKENVGANCRFNKS